MPLLRDDLVHARLERCKKIVMLNTGLTWILYDPASGQKPQHMVMAVEVESPQSDYDRTHAVWTTVHNTTDAKEQTHKQDVGDVRGDWIGEQMSEIDGLKTEAPKDADVIRLSLGLHVLLQEGQTAKVLVPAARRRALTLQAHKNINTAVGTKPWTNCARATTGKICPRRITV